MTILYLIAGIVAAVVAANLAGDNTAGSAGAASVSYHFILPPPPTM